MCIRGKTNNGQMLRSENMKALFALNFTECLFEQTLE